MTQLLEEAKTMSKHGRKKVIDVEDVRLGSSLLREKNYARPPSRVLVSRLARSKNKIPLTLPGLRLGVRLPPERFCLTATNIRYNKNFIFFIHSDHALNCIKILFVRLKKKKNVTRVENFPVRSSPLDSSKIISPSDCVDPPVFTIQFDLDQNNCFTLTDYTGQKNITEL